MIKSGELQVGDATLFIPRELKDLRTGSMISNTFRPQLHDEFKEDGIWYKILSIQSQYIGESEVAFECESRRIGNDNQGGWS